MEHRELYRKLIDDEMAFLPKGEIALKTIYKTVKDNYPILCDDNVLCRDICTQGANEPEWKHRVRTVLYRLKKQGIIQKSLTRGFWVINGDKNVIINKSVKLPDGTLEPVRVENQIFRVIRDTNLSVQLKKLHMNSCQICGTTIKLNFGKMYSEAHHIVPLGSNHSGPDIAENIIIVCPNHHVLCDYGAIKLNKSNLRLKEGHNISEEYIKYHNEVIFSG